MPGERLMCMWQVVYARDSNTDSGPDTPTVRKVTEMLSSGLNVVNFVPSTFDSIFKDLAVDFDEYVTYVRETLRETSVPRHLLARQIESACWRACSSLYKSSVLNEAEIMKLWYVFNRISARGSYPPTAQSTEINWMLEKFATSLGRTWTDNALIPESGLEFSALLGKMEQTVMAGCSPEVLVQAVEDIFTWLVREVMKSGWMQKRTKKQSNWTNWKRRWFVLTPNGLDYFETERMVVRKGTVVVDEKSVMEDVPDADLASSKSSSRRKQINRFRVCNRPALEIEVCAESQLDKQQWMANIARCIDTAADGVTPMAALLATRALKRKESVQLMDEQIQKAQVAARQGTRRMKNGPMVTRQTSSLDAVTEEDLPPPPPPITAEEEEFDNNLEEEERQKIQAVFSRIDKNGNGKIDKQEFTDFITTLGLKLSTQETDLIFQGVDKDGSGEIYFDEFYNYFVETVMGQNEVCAAETQLRAAFLAADRDGSGSVNFKEFSEYAWSRSCSININKLVDAFDKLDVDNSGEISFKEFRDFFKSDDLTRSKTIKKLAKAETNSNQPAIEKMLKGVYDTTEASEMATFLRKRWDAFASFRRTNPKGELVMSGASGMAGDMLPGEYTLLDLACFSDLPPIEPKITVVKDYVWQPSGIPGKSGRLVFPETWSGVITTEIATNENLAYYGCTLAEGNQLKVSLLYRHGLQDFTYENNYMDDYVMAEDSRGGAGIEKHGFSHLDCPLDQESGIFVLGKEVDGEIHLTGFKIPRRHTIYVPPFVIHSNDYLKGTWRTMLSDEAEIDHVQIVKRSRKAGVETYKFFKFEFEKIIV